MKQGWICSRCGETGSGQDEYTAELSFNNHTCNGLPDLSKLPLDLLRKLATQEITEAEAIQLNIQTQPGAPGEK